MFASLSRSNNATVNFTGTNLGQDGLGNSQINLTQINTLTPALVQNMIGGFDAYQPQLEVLRDYGIACAGAAAWP